MENIAPKINYGLFNFLETQYKKTSKENISF